MTGSAFLKRLNIGLDFLSDEDREVVMQYYRDKLSYANTISEEEETVKGFGSPEHICKKLREAIEEKDEPREPDVLNEDLTDLPKAEPDLSHPVPEDEDLTAIPAPERSENPRDDEDAPEDVIFHKPPAEEEGHEFVQSIEDHESFNLYGKKVEVNKEEKTFDLPEEEDDLSPEELEAAKLLALEKASQFDSEALEDSNDESSLKQDGPSESKLDPSASKMHKDSADPPPEYKGPAENEVFELDSDETSDPDAEDGFDDESIQEETDVPDDDEELRVTRAYTGLIKKLFPNAEDKTLLTLKIVFSVLFSPVLALLFGAVIALYTGLVAAIVLAGLIAFILMVSFVIGGVLELVFGITQLFSSVPIGLIEIGLGLILFGILTAVVSFLYEFVFSLVPIAIKRMTRLLKKIVLLLVAVIYGGRA